MITSVGDIAIFWIGLVFLVILVVVGLVAGANQMAQAYLRHHSVVLASPEERLSQLNRKLREELVPQDKRALWFDLQAADEQYAMWDEFYGNAGNIFESFVHFRPPPFIGKYFGVAPQGYRLTREPGPWPPQPAHFNVMFFGGSTAFGVGPYWATVASYLQDVMNASGDFARKVYVYNFGRSSYFSTQEMILYNRLISESAQCDMAVFMDGMNDFHFYDGNPSSWRELAIHVIQDNENAKRALQGYGIITHWEKLVEFVTTLPLIRFLAAMSELHKPLAADPKADEAALPPDQAQDSSTVAQVVMRYIRNMVQVKAAAEAIGVVPVFLWQPHPLHKYDTRYHLFMPPRFGHHVNAIAGYPLMERMAKRKPLGENFVWAADMQADANECLYVDSFHYTAPMCKRIAEFLYQTVQTRNLIPATKRGMGL